MAKAAGTASSSQSSGCSKPGLNQACVSFLAVIFQVTQAAGGSVHHVSKPGAAGEFLTLLKFKKSSRRLALSWFSRIYCLGGRIRLALASRREVRADSLQKCPYFLSKGMHFRFVDQLQHGLDIHEGNRYGSIGFFTHDHVARQ